MVILRMTKRKEWSVTMAITHKKIEDGIVIEYTGELGHHEAKEAMRYIENIIDLYAPPRLIFDLHALTFMDSSGIAVIMCGYRNMRDIGAAFYIKDVPGQAMKVLTAAGVDRIVRFTHGGVHKDEAAK
ncbi:MAG: anti-sigma factor antagonist [Clostridiales bacterium]|nr:anti-sigma factor antagonist [Clostridiales bacterium]